MDQFITVKDAAKKLNLGYATILKLIRKKELASYYFGNKYRIKESDLTKFLFSKKPQQ